jgi:16S rRNA (uracil1498-N3)-methyltransferase
MPSPCLPAIPIRYIADKNGNMERTNHFLFFAEDISSSELELDTIETRHAIGALRLHTGDTLHITDGKGTLATGVLDSVPGNRCGHLTIIARKSIDRKPPSITLGIGIPERDAFESVLSDATALGVYRIIPIIMYYCQKRWWESDWDKLAVRFRHIMIAALKQSQGLFLPQLSPPCNLDGALSECSGKAIVADPYGDTLHTILQQTGFPTSITCFIGPPGGFFENEQRLFMNHSITPVKIAPLRLRTELAATTLCAQISGYLL